METYHLRTFISGIAYPLRRVIWKTSNELIKAANLARLCFPLPPTPTSRALPRGDSKIRLIRHLNKTSIVSENVGPFAPDKCNSLKQQQEQQRQHKHQQKQQNSDKQRPSMHQEQ